MAEHFRPSLVGSAGRPDEWTVTFAIESLRAATLAQLATMVRSPQGQTEIVQRVEDQRDSARQQAQRRLGEEARDYPGTKITEKEVEDRTDELLEADTPEYARELAFEKVLAGAGVGLISSQTHELYKSVFTQPHYKERAQLVYAGRHAYFPPLLKKALSKSSLHRLFVSRGKLETYAQEMAAIAKQQPASGYGAAAEAAEPYFTSASALNGHRAQIGVCIAAIAPPPTVLVSIAPEKMNDVQPVTQALEAAGLSAIPVLTGVGGFARTIDPTAKPPERTFVGGHERDRMGLAHTSTAVPMHATNRDATMLKGTWEGRPFFALEFPPGTSDIATRRGLADPELRRETNGDLVVVLDSPPPNPRRLAAAIRDAVKERRPLTTAIASDGNPIGFVTELSSLEGVLAQGQSLTAMAERLTTSTSHPPIAVAAEPTIPRGRAPISPAPDDGRFGR